MMACNPITVDSCPACGAKANHLLNWEFSGLGDSVFNYTANYFNCRGCGLVYIRNTDDARLARFYTDECSYFEKPNYAVTSPINRDRYVFYARFLRENNIAAVDMADIGCGRGGFVKWLAQSGWAGTCWGVDVDFMSMPASSSEPGQALFNNGGALNLPFQTESMGLLTYLHVVEHIRDLRGLLVEAVRVLQRGGHILIEVPDAENYAAQSNGSAFWMTIREHVYHFTAKSLCEALYVSGFSVVKVSRQILPTPDVSYPSLMILAKKVECPSVTKFPISGDVAGFVLESRHALLEQASRITALVGDGKLSIWGCSSEFFSLLPMLDMRNIRLCDSSSLKQIATYKGVSIRAPTDLSVDGILVVVPYLHAMKIKSAALQLGWPEDAIYALQ